MKIDIQRAIEVLAACGYECPELEEIPVAGVITLAGRVLGRDLTPPECRELGFFLGEMATGKQCFADTIQQLRRELEAANELIRTYRAESTQLATMYPFPTNLESPEFRLLFEIGEMMRKLGSLTHAERLHKLALRLQAEWLKAVKA